MSINTSTINFRSSFKSAAKCSNPLCPRESNINSATNSTNSTNSTDNITKRCKACKIAWYCCKQCQNIHWKNGHKNECVYENIKYTKMPVSLDSFIQQKIEDTSMENTLPNEILTSSNNGITIANDENGSEEELLASNTNSLPYILSSKHNFIKFVTKHSKILDNDVSYIIFRYLTAHIKTFTIQHIETTEECKDAETPYNISNSSNHLSNVFFNHDHNTDDSATEHNNLDSVNSKSSSILSNINIDYFYKDRDCALTQLRTQFESEEAMWHWCHKNDIQSKLEFEKLIMKWKVTNSPNQANKNRISKTQRKSHNSPDSQRLRYRSVSQKLNQNNTSINVENIKLTTENSDEVSLETSSNSSEFANKVFSFDVKRSGVKTKTNEIHGAEDGNLDSSDVSSFKTKKNELENNGNFRNFHNFLAFNWNNCDHYGIIVKRHFDTNIDRIELCIQFQYNYLKLENTNKMDAMPIIDFPIGFMETNDIMTILSTKEYALLIKEILIYFNIPYFEKLKYFGLSFSINNDILWRKQLLNDLRIILNLPKLKVTSDYYEPQWKKWHRLNNIMNNIFNNTSQRVSILMITSSQFYPRNESNDGNNDNNENDNNNNNNGNNNDSDIEIEIEFE